jgi:site-specific recombinase XerC
MRAPEITEFVHREAVAKHGFGRKVPAVAIRSLLRFLVFCGELPPGLEAATPLPRHWQHAALPKHLSSEQIAQVLATCQQDTPQGLRDRAILLLLARLGLRAGVPRTRWSSATRY